VRAKEFIVELNMAPGNLLKFANSPAAQNMRAGFEAEVILPGEYTDSGDTEADWDQDEDIPPNIALSDIKQFFELSARDSALENINEAYFEWYNDKQAEYADENLAERMEYLSNKHPEDYAEDEEACREKAWDELCDEFNHDANYYDASMYDWLRDGGLDLYSLIGEEFDLTWPHYKSNTGFGDAVGNYTYDMQQELGIEIEINDDYHSQEKKFGTGNWYFEPDTSIRPQTLPDYNDDMMGVEIVSPPMPIAEMLDKMERTLKWVIQQGGQTNESTGFHVGISMEGQTTENVDYVKLALFLGDAYVLQRFGREANTYTKSSMQLVQRMAEIKSVGPVGILLDQMKQGLLHSASKEVLAKNDTKFVSINMKPGYIEFRGMGYDYLPHIEVIRNTVLRYIRAYAVAGDPNAERQEYARKLTRLLNPEGKDQLTPFVKYAMARGKEEPNAKEDLVNMLTVRKKQKAYDAMTPDEKRRAAQMRQASGGGMRRMPPHPQATSEPQMTQDELARAARASHNAYQSSQQTTSEPIDPEPMTQDELAQAARASHDRYQNG
jgi:hypothetical protein